MCVGCALVIPLILQFPQILEAFQSIFLYLHFQPEQIS
jgi:hypothetical protein